VSDVEFVAQLEKHLALEARLSVGFGLFFVVALALTVWWCARKMMKHRHDYDSPWEFLGVLGVVFGAIGLLVSLAIALGNLSTLLDPHGAAVTSYTRHRVEMQQESGR
jgi:hypothetical protein